MLGNESVILRTIVDGDLVVGNIVCFPMEDEQNIGYWIGRAHWGRGYATAALSDFVGELPTRPLYARVAKHNVGSSRVLAKCGFIIIGEETHEGDPVTEVVWRLDS